MSDKSQIKTDTGRSDQELVAELMAKAEGIGMVGENGLLSRLTKTTLENVLQAGMESIWALALHERSAENGGNARDGARSTTVTTEAGPVEIEVPRDRDGSFTPAIVKKRQRRLNGVNSRRAVAVSQRPDPRRNLCAPGRGLWRRGLKSRPSRSSPNRPWNAWPSGRTGPWIRSMRCCSPTPSTPEIRGGQVANRPIYVVLGVTAEGERDILGLWAG
ncbi:hypothetical protein HDA32_000611 [Spinactinospora alkalitolerans]|uniref:Mutator family transposase n=1 Tax=Spinactinospora alkalitolerans TaxID=687207 RepID=A0A852TPS6_9ACTN|nr:transposase [Spinactinospora alkalitolerans]NYE45491.1 hypothetical protein [Spinactinospora alkalitolerans]